MTNVAMLPNGSITGEPFDKAVELLEVLLERAKKGDIQQIAVAVMDNDGVSTTSWHSNLGKSAFSLIGVVGYLHYRMNAHLDSH